MLTNAYNRQVFLWLLLCVVGITAVARVDKNWSNKRSKVVGFRPAYKNNQTQWQRNNQTHVQSYNNFKLQTNNRTQFNQPGSRPGVNNPQPPRYGQAAFNQTRSSWQQPSASNPTTYPAYGQKQRNFNQTRPTWQQPQTPMYKPYPANGSHAFPNQTQPSNVNQAHPSQGYFNQNHPLRPQPFAPKASNYPQYPASGKQSTLNQTLPAWSHPSSTQLPNYPAAPQNSNSWLSSRNQTNLYPKLPNLNSPQATSAIGVVPQGPHNGHSGGQASLSYGPDQRPLPAGNSNKTVPVRSGNSNPYANIFN